MLTGTGLQAVVFDWAGTVVDHGSRAPVDVFRRAFAEFGVELTDAEARGPMGRAKRDHIADVLDLPRVRQAWRSTRGEEPDEADVERVYEVFVPLNVAVVTEHADLIEGTADVAARLRARGLKIGSTTGYTRAIMEPLLPLAAAQGFAPDCVVCAGEVPTGRPAPLMLYRSFVELGVWPASAVVVVDDTPAGVRAGLAAGCWTVGVALTGNAFGLSLEATAALDEAERARREAAAYAELARAGAHAVIDGVAALEGVLDEIEGALARGERP